MGANAMPDKAAVKDRIDIRYSVIARFEVKGRDRKPRYPRGFFSIIAGTYAGDADYECLAELISSRTVQPEDLQEIEGISREEMAKSINARGVQADDIQSATIEDVLLDDRVIATRLLRDPKVPCYG